MKNRKEAMMNMREILIRRRDAFGKRLRVISVC